MSRQLQAIIALAGACLLLDFAFGRLTDEIEHLAADQVALLRYQRQLHDRLEREAAPDSAPGA